MSDVAEVHPVIMQKNDNVRNQGK